MTKKCLKMTHSPLFPTVELFFVCLVVVFLQLPGTVRSQNQEINWKNPILIGGIDFGRVFQAYYKTNNQNMLLTLTAHESREIYGDSIIKAYYSKMQFMYEIRLIAHKKVDNRYILTYKAIFMATSYIMHMRIVIENDTSRLLLPMDFTKQDYFLLK
jgi:hypothetical protein